MNLSLYQLVLTTSPIIIKKVETQANIECLHAQLITACADFGNVSI